ncbi:MAG: nucleotide pyrophosphohydrolase [Rhizobiales bacterium]|nr:nucleotide pyrophosphohydrolase [Hyphomicrobiales bacterium]
MEDLTGKLLAFRDARDWKQFHSLKNLILSLNLEASELLELTQWKTDEEVEHAIGSAEFSQKAGEECADILLYLLLIAERAGLDLIAAADAKIAKNAQKYPIEKSKGNARKYTEL